MPRPCGPAASVAQPGDVVLLAPAAASMDQFTDYADRGSPISRAERLAPGAARLSRRRRELVTTTRPPRAAEAAPLRLPSPSRRPPRAAVVAVRRLFAAETPEYFLLLGTTLFLVVFGLVMVLSSSSIESHVEQQGLLHARPPARVSTR